MKVITRDYKGMVTLSDPKVKAFEYKGKAYIVCEDPHNVADCPDDGIVAVCLETQELDRFHNHEPIIPLSVEATAERITNG